MSVIKWSNIDRYEVSFTMKMKEIVCRVRFRPPNNRFMAIYIDFPIDDLWQISGYLIGSDRNSIRIAPHELSVCMRRDMTHTNLPDRIICLGSPRQIIIVSLKTWKTKLNNRSNNTFETNPRTRIVRRARIRCRSRQFPR